MAGKWMRRSLIGGLAVAVVVATGLGLRAADAGVEPAGSAVAAVNPIGSGAYSNLIDDFACLDAVNNTVDDPVGRTQAGRCLFQEDTIWTIELDPFSPPEDGVQLVVTVGANSRCLAASGGATAVQGAAATLLPCHSSDPLQRWTFVQQNIGDGTLFVMSSVAGTAALGNGAHYALEMDTGSIERVGGLFLDANVRMIAVNASNPPFSAIWSFTGQIG